MSGATEPGPATEPVPAVEPTPAGAGAKAHVLLADIGGAGESALALPDDVAHHLLHVLRLRAGDVVTATDGRGGWRPTRLVTGGAGLEPTAASLFVPRPRPPVGVGFALTKGDKPELVVQKLTELGVDRIVPFVAERSVVSWDPTKAERNVARWRAVAREALRQSRQVWEPQVAAVGTFAEVCREPHGIVRADLGGDPPDPERHHLVLVGPEGGWSSAERGAAVATVSLGLSILRAETAAIVAGTLLVGIRAGLVNAVR